MIDCATQPKHYSDEKVLNRAILSQIKASVKDWVVAQPRMIASIKSLIIVSMLVLSSVSEPLPLLIELPVCSVVS